MTQRAPSTGKPWARRVGGVMALLLVAGALWTVWRGPTSPGEAVFLHRLAQSVTQDQPQIDLGVLMPGEWETVCGAHGYGGDFSVKGYGRTYPAVGDLQDGAWGLVFISADGSFTSAHGDCRSARALLSLEGCLPRGRAVLHRFGAAATCTSFH